MGSEHNELVNWFYSSTYNLVSDYDIYITYGVDEPHWAVQKGIIRWAFSTAREVINMVEDLVMWGRICA